MRNADRNRPRRPYSFLSLSLNSRRGASHRRVCFSAPTHCSKNPTMSISSPLNRIRNPNFYA
jgi:hypothetical protein